LNRRVCGGNGSAMKRHAVTAAVLTSISALSLASCGESEQDKVRAVAALMANRDPAACDAMTEAAYPPGPMACRQLLEGTGAPKSASVKDVTTRGDTATAVISRDRAESVVRLLKRDGDWKIADIGAVERAGNAREENPGPKVQFLPTARKTVDAYLQAIADEDGPALCGLLSERYAVKVVGDGPSEDPIGDCVKALQEFDWTAAHQTAEGVRTTSVARSGATAVVGLSSGKRALLERSNARWVIDDIKG
jgi:hypothetical protein